MVLVNDDGRYEGDIHDQNRQFALECLKTPTSLNEFLKKLFSPDLLSTIHPEDAKRIPDVVKELFTTDSEKWQQSLERDQKFYLALLSTFVKDYKEFLIRQDFETRLGEPILLYRLVNCEMDESPVETSGGFSSNHDGSIFTIAPASYTSTNRRKCLLPDGSAIFRTFKHDVQLIPPCTGAMFPTICRGVVRQHLGSMLHYSPMDRINMLAVIPELHILLVGSQIGRVALLSLTKLRDGFSKFGPVVMFRVDLILPLKKHDDERNRPDYPLLGMSVAPLRRSQNMAGPRRWRLLMHYCDHTILSYEIFRDDDAAVVVT